jgi:chemotaxis protein methyltransferase CheR
MPPRIELSADADVPAHEELRAWVRHQFGIAYGDDQALVFADRIETVCFEIKLTPEVLLLRLAAGDVSVTRRLAEAVSTNHTYFFREPEVFELLSRCVFPALPAGGLRLWSAAASSGDEAYSLAIAAHEHFGPDAGDRVRVLGTDLSERQLRLAEEGAYPAYQLGELSPTRARWFEPAGPARFRVVPALRRMCTFRRLNLMVRPFPFEQRFHVVFLRNILFYFDPPVRRRLLEACYDATEPGGWLCTSLTESITDLQTRWVPVASAVYRRSAS